VSSGDSAELSIALLVRNVAVIVCMLGTETPVACLPEGALFCDVIGAQLIALKAVGELGLAPSTLLA